MTAMNQDKLQGVDYEKVEALQRKRVLKFVNHFVLQMTNFLSNFSQTCDTKLLSISKRLSDLETSLVLLEHKLDSVPQLRNLPTLQMDTELAILPTTQPAPVQDQEDQVDLQESLIEPFKKMLQVGVPEEAVKQKMTVQGIDPNLLFS